MSENIIRKSPLAVRRALGNFVGRKVSEGTHGDPKRDSWNYDCCYVDGIVAKRSRKGNFIVTVTFWFEGCQVCEYDFEAETETYDYKEDWRLVIRKSDGQILSESPQVWYNNYGF